MKKDINDYFILNDLSIDREKYKRVVKSIPNTRWTIDNRGAVYNSYGKVAAYDPIWDGSPRVRISKQGCQRYHYVNDLVLRTFVGPPPSDKHVPWHCDGDRENCSLDNLSWQVVI
jgi:hypothetical protein